MVEYTSSRLCFKADLIEPLNDNDSFIVHIPDETFKFTKADFYRVFSNVIEPVGFNTNTSIEDLEISDIEDHFRKYVNPNNMFVLPKEIGYLGEIDVFIEEQKR